MWNMQLSNPINWHILIGRFISQNKNIWQVEAGAKWNPSQAFPILSHLRWKGDTVNRTCRQHLVQSLPVDICRESRSIQGLFRVQRGTVQIFTIIMINQSAIVWHNAIDKCYTRHIDNIRSLSLPDNHLGKTSTPDFRKYGLDYLMHGAEFVLKHTTTLSDIHKF